MAPRRRSAEATPSSDRRGKPGQWTPAKLQSHGDVLAEIAKELHEAAAWMNAHCLKEITVQNQGTVQESTDVIRNFLANVTMARLDAVQTGAAKPTGQGIDNGLSEKLSD